jgi:hypothetical protein
LAQQRHEQGRDEKGQHDRAECVSILPLEREGLIRVRPGRGDRRSKEVHLTDAGDARFAAGLSRWQEAQRDFEATFGGERAAELRRLMRLPRSSSAPRSRTLPSRHGPGGAPSSALP